MGLQMGNGTVQLEWSCIFGLGWISVLDLVGTGCCFLEANVVTTVTFPARELWNQSGMVFAEISDAPVMVTLLSLRTAQCE